MIARRYRDLPIRAKLLAPFMVLMIVWGAFGSYVLVRGATSEARGRATAHLAASLDGARAAFAETERSLLETQRLAGHTEGVAAAIAAGDRDRLRALLTPIAVNAGHAKLAALAADRTVLVAIETTGEAPVVTMRGRVDLPAVVGAAAGVRDELGDKWSGIAVEGFVVAGPVRDDAQQVIGVIAVWEALDPLVARMRRGSDGSVTLFDADGAPLAASGPAVPYREAGEGLRAQVLGSAEPLEALYAPFEVRGVRVGTLGVASPSSVALGAVARTAAVLGLLVALAVVAAGVIGWLTARAITRPVAVLVDATRALERGDLHARADVDSRDEVGALASAFNTMATELQASHEELERKVAERTAELERVNREIAVANEELARASAMKSAFLATMSHELRTPLNAIIGFGDMLSDPSFGRPDVRTVRELSGNIVRSGRHLLTIINDVLDLARVEAGRIEFEPQPTDLADVLEEVTSVLRPLADAKRQRLVVQHISRLPLVHADARRLRQILFNLVSNAIKYTPERGSVRVAAERARSRVTVRVIDDGPGLTPEEAARVFDPFERGAAARSIEGAGLGLALARKLVQMHGSDITVGARPRRGSIFSFSMLVARSSAVRKRAKEARVG